MSLSAKFAQLKSGPKPAGKDNRKANQIVASKDKRAAVTAAKRGLTLPGKKGGAAAAKGKTQIKKVNVKGKLNRTASAGGNNDSAGKRPRGKGKVGGKGPKGKGGKKQGGEKPKPVTAADLDGDMDDYWFKGGKGPDPKLAALDREIEEYNASKSAAAPAADASV